MKTSIVVFAFLGILLVAGCAKVPLAPQEQDIARKDFAPPSPGTAGLYIFRNSNYGSAVLKPLNINDSFIGNTAPMTYFYLEVAPGEHTLSTLGETSTVELEINFKADRQYFVRHFIKTGFFAASAGLERVSGDYGREGVLECSLAEIENTSLLAKISGTEATYSTGSSATTINTQVNTSSEGTTVHDYYGAAEEEINTNTYDKNLWARALVEVEGDERKRKVKYIELRAQQIYSEKGGSTPDVVVSKQAESGVNVSGTYVSKIKSNVPYWFQTKKDRELIVTIKQNGNKITGNAGSTDSEITGTIEGDTIKFTFWSSGPTDGSSLRGTWTFFDGGSRMKGVWGYGGGSSGGTWDLKKVE